MKPSKLPTTAIAILQGADKPIRKADLFTKVGLCNNSVNTQRHIKPLLERDLLAMTDPEHPRSSRQMYILTDRGREFLE